MDIAFCLAVGVAGTVIAFAVKAKKWVLIVTIWLCVPVGILLSTTFGFYVAKIGDTATRARGPVSCIVHGYDVSDWMNSLVISGYVIAFVAGPWFVIGAICLAIFGIFRVVDIWRV